MQMLVRSAARIMGFAPFTAAVAAISLAAWLTPGLAQTLQYDRAAMAAGQWWRGATGHLAHWSGEHLFWDVIVFLALGAVVESQSRLTWLACVTASAAAISWSLWAGQPALETYRGLSGIDTALFGALSVGLLLESVREQSVKETLLASILLAGCVGKIAWEWVSGEAMFVDAAASGFITIPLAHLAGGVVGAIAACCEQSRLAHQSRQSQRDCPQPASLKSGRDALVGLTARQRQVDYLQGS